MLERYLLHDRPEARVFLTTMLENFEALGAYIRIEGAYAVITDPDMAGAGATFILDAFDSLMGGDPIRLRRIGALDARNRVIFLHALAAFLGVRI